MILVFLRHLFGLDSPSSLGYLFWSGCVCACALLGNWYQNWKRNNCHHEWCFRTSRHTLDSDGHHTTYCHKHIEDAKRRRDGA